MPLCSLFFRRLFFLFAASYPFPPSLLSLPFSSLLPLFPSFPPSPLFLSLSLSPFLPLQAVGLIRYEKSQYDFNPHRNVLSSIFLSPFSFPFLSCRLCFHPPFPLPLLFPPLSSLLFIPPLPFPLSSTPSFTLTLPLCSPFF